MFFKLLYCRLSLFLLLASLFTTQASAKGEPPEKSSDRYLRQVDELSALWSYYKYHYIVNGKVVSLDEEGVTTSEGQGYAMLRSVWSGDRHTFDSVWNWTQENLQIREDKLFAWKWKGKVLSPNSATDADTDIALALILASRRFSAPSYEKDALAILDSIWNQEVLEVDSQYYATAGNWAVREEFPAIHVAYLAPYAYEVFAGVDPRHPWKRLIDSSYRILHWSYFEQRFKLPPEIIYIDKGTGELLLRNPKTGDSALFSYDAFPIFWRVALDAKWFGRGEGGLRRKMLEFFKEEWKSNGKFLDRYTLSGLPLSRNEGLPLYPSVHSLALREDPALAEEIERDKLRGLFTKSLAGKDTPYYLHNWLWFGRAAELGKVLTFDDFLGFLRPFDFRGFSVHFPWVLFAAAIALFLFAGYHPAIKISFLLLAFYLCVRYLLWRLTHSLNFIESWGPFISVSLWIAEAYSFSGVLFLLLQVGMGGKKTEPPAAGDSPGLAPTVDVYIPIYTESCDILENTLNGACAIKYPKKKIYVLDDSHREEVAALAARHGAAYIKGPKRHAKAGNLNHALTQTRGELIAVFDTDHIPTTAFLEETVSLFVDPKMGFVQTPHHFYNQDIFQRAFGASRRIPNEQDMFNHAIQGGRQSWGGAFFVGSGAVFRRSALEEVRGFNLMSMTEDIHTSQHLHAAGWRSAFIDKDLAVGLAAENLSSYIVQRRRWMLGCLQIFFKDNPLICRGLSLRRRLGYFASLYYFFFPIARVIYWITPLYYLLFHLHPIFSEVSILVAYLLPYLILVPLILSTLLPGWPRMLWGNLYETTISFSLFRAMFDLLLPKRLGFKVTPKGVVSEKRIFDSRSAKPLLWAASINIVAIAKGLGEFFYFGIEKDAYFFNLGWAFFNLLLLLGGLLIAWEKPQRRSQLRINKVVPFELQSDGFSLKGETRDLSLSGGLFFTEDPREIPTFARITFTDDDTVSCRCRLVYRERASARSSRCGLEFIDLPEETRRKLALKIFSSPDTWEAVHAVRVRSNIVMALHFLVGIVRCLLPLRNRTRKGIRKRSFCIRSVKAEGRMFKVIAQDVSRKGVGLVYFGKEPPLDTAWTVFEPQQEVRCFPVYRKKRVPYVWRVGLKLSPTPERKADALRMDGVGVVKQI